MERRKMDAGRVKDNQKMASLKTTRKCRERKDAGWREEGGENRLNKAVNG